MLVPPTTPWIGPAGLAGAIIVAPIIPGIASATALTAALIATTSGRAGAVVAGGGTLGTGAAKGGHLLAAGDVGVVGLFLGTIVVPADPELLQGLADEADGGALS